jgi:hypothetical protein
MKLGNHPLMCHRSVPNWPPTWVSLHQTRRASLEGEIGTLNDVIYSKRFPNKCFLIIEHDSSGYMGTLTFDDHTFCQQIADLLRCYLHRPIREISDVDIEIAALIN